MAQGSAGVQSGKMAKWAKVAAIFAFGDGPLRCPAESFAPAFAALIASKVMDRVDGVRHKLVQSGNTGSTTYCWEGWVVHKAPVH